jgi:alginate O-acetyltransferase complex protein AlgI
MVFSSSQFLFLFLPFVLLLASFGSIRYQNLSLIVCSLGFYYYGGGVLVALLFVSCIANWLFGLLLERVRNPAALTLGILFNVGILVYYKYANFFVSEFNRMAGGTRLEIRHWENIALPIGISFFTFQGMSYMLDVWRRETKAYRNPLDILLCITFFPHLIAGPIVRINHLGSQLKERRRSWDEFCIGASRFIWGLAKKVLVADMCGKVADAGFGVEPKSLPMGAAGLAVVAYTFQIYFDFSGYSDMAIGLARMFGFRFPENFDHPYTSLSITDFWRRWHMSLSQWVRDYLYIPLGGNRVATIISYRNILIVFLVTGFWHGASWTFVVWGLYHGVLSVIEHLLHVQKLDDHRLAVPRRILTLLLVMISWVIFRSKTMESAVAFLQAMAGRFHHQHYPGSMLMVMDLQTFVALAVGAMSIFATRQNTGGKLMEGNSAFAYKLRWVVLVLVFPVALCQVISSDYSPFLYFKF